MKKVVCIGSNKYYDDITSLCSILNANECVVIYPAYCDKPKEEMNELMYSGLLYGHLNKIDFADIVILFDFEGYVGLSTAIELGYAKAKNKPILAISHPEDESIAGMIDFYLPEEIDSVEDSNKLDYCRHFGEFVERFLKEIPVTTNTITGYYFDRNIR